jgi:Mrp family chromosome partitioning ATPase
VTDAAVLAALSDGALVVVSAGRTLDTELGAALGHLEAVNGKALGVIFNRVARKDTESGYYGEYYGTARRVGEAISQPSGAGAPGAPVTPTASRAAESQARR